MIATPRRSDRPGLLHCLNTTVKPRARLIAERGVAREEMTVRPEDTLRAAGITSRRQARYPAAHVEPARGARVTP